MNTERPGYYQGRHYTTYLGLMDSLKRSEKNEQLEALLFHLIDATEREAFMLNQVVAPAYYREMAILYRKQGRDTDELAILQRYAALPPERRQRQKAELLERLEKVKQRIAKKRL
jgi:hypothetical protein